ncbi:MAG TPA: POTRA domain-containing protein [Chitinophagaceae bacterium]|nr:POTRA domain-containing protein [Chitinophagaceae bacterium]
MSGNTLIYSTSEGITGTPDTTKRFLIREIHLSGNQRTKSHIVLRELSFRELESYPLSELVEKFAETRQQLMNTGLFSDVVVALGSLQGYDVYVNITVKERWYIFPLPFLRMVDRNFNEWVKEDMSLKRVNYGLRVVHNNTTGRNDKLTVYLMNGHTKQVAFSYNGLYLDKGLHWSSNMGFSFGKNKEVRYETVNNKQMALRVNDEFVNSYFRSFFELNYRRAIKTRHTIGVSFGYEDLADTIFQMNPAYSRQQKVVSFPEIFYRLSHFNVDYIPYPTKGYAGELGLTKRGFSKDVNLWQLSARGSGTWPLSEKSFFNLRAAGMLKLPFRQPYIMKQFMGYDNNFTMQGYEHYVIEGVAGGYAKTAFARQLVNTTIHIPSQRIKKLNDIPLRIYAKVFGNTGYVYDPEPGDNRLSNRMLYSGGFGIDVVTAYDLVLKFEWSFNSLGQNGLYLHRKNYF